MQVRERGGRMGKWKEWGEGMLSGKVPALTQAHRGLWGMCALPVVAVPPQDQGVISYGPALAHVNAGTSWPLFFALRSKEGLRSPGAVL